MTAGSGRGSIDLSGRRCRLLRQTRCWTTSLLLTRRARFVGVPRAFLPARQLDDAYFPLIMAPPANYRLEQLCVGMTASQQVPSQFTCTHAHCQPAPDKDAYVVNRLRELSLERRDRVKNCTAASSKCGHNCAAASKMQVTCSCASMQSWGRTACCACDTLPSLPGGSACSCSGRAATCGWRWKKSIKRNNQRFTSTAWLA
jgi:hypothetical protein